MSILNPPNPKKKGLPPGGTPGQVLTKTETGVEWRDPSSVVPNDVFQINLSSDPADGGVVSGGGYASEGMTCNAKAEPAKGYIFDGWKENGETVENDPNYSFAVSQNRSLIADFAKPKIYGVTWDGSSTTKLMRTDGAKDFAAPVAAVGNGSGSSPFDNIMPWSGMKRVIQDENELVAIPKYYLKVTHDPFTVQISSEYFEGFQVSPAHRDRGDGQGERDVVYIGRYECDDSYMSRTGKSPKASTNLATFRSGIAALGAEYWQADFALQLTWWYLYIVEFADWNGQTAIGQGVVNFSAKINTGGTDSMIYHTGRAAGTDGQTAIQYRGVENPWGNVREWRDGIIFSDTNICTYNNPANFVDTYNGTGATMWSNKRAAEAGWIKAWGYDSNDASFIYPSTVGGSETQYVPDHCNYNTGVCALNVGGSWSDRTSAGPFYLNGYHTPTSTSAYIGSRLQKLPNK